MLSVIGSRIVISGSLATPAEPIRTESGSPVLFCKSSQCVSDNWNSCACTGSSSRVQVGMCILCHARSYFSCCQMLNVSTRGDPRTAVHKDRHACTRTAQTIHLITVDAAPLRERGRRVSHHHRRSDYPATSYAAAHMNVLIKTLITDVTAGHY